MGSRKIKTAFFVLLFLLTSFGYAQNSPPKIEAVGDSFFCIGSEQPIVTSLSISNPSNLEIVKLFIQISEGYVSSQDRLKLTGTHPTISTNFSVSEGKLTLSTTTSGVTAMNDLISASKDVVFYSTNNVSGIKKFSFTVNEKNYLPSTGHFYEYVKDVGVTWTNAKSKAESLKYYGLQGYLATITSYDEVKLSGEQAKGTGWIGASDSGSEGTWKWVTGPEIGKTFWIGGVNGSTNGTDLPYEYWNNNEPNNLGNEDYAHITAPSIGIKGSWNDLANSGANSGDYQPKGYIVEYGGMPGDPIVNFGNNETTLKVAEILNSNGDERCGAGEVTLRATSTSGFVIWFETLTGGAPIETGNILKTTVNTSTTFYAVASSNGTCTSGKRTPVLTTVNEIPTIIAATSKSICFNGSTSITASSNTGVVRWYSTKTGGTPFFQGNEYNTPNLTTSKTYFVEAFDTNTGCTSLTRTEVTITVTQVPEPTTTQPEQSFCNVQNATLNDLIITGNSIKWYATNSGGTVLENTTILKHNTTYFTTQTINGCESANRLTIEVNVYDSPESLVEIPTINNCDSNTTGTDVDGFEIFDLTQNEPSILNGKSKNDFNIFYYSNSNLTTEITNPKAYKNKTANAAEIVYFKIENKNLNSCQVSGSFKIEVQPKPVLRNTTVILEQCDDDENNDGFSVFNLNEANELISTNYENEFFEFYNDASFNNQIEDPIAYTNPKVINSEVFVKISTEYGCERTAKIILKVGATQIPPNFHRDYYVCENYPANNQDGRNYFNFSDVFQELVATKNIFSSQKVRVFFYEGLEDALSEINPIEDISNYKNTTPWEQKIYVRIDSDDVNACLGLNHVVTLHVEPLPVATPVTIERQCDDNQDGFFPFDVSTIDAQIRNGQTEILIRYFDENNNEFPSPLPNPFLTKNQTITIRVENENSDLETPCFDETTLEFIVDDAPEIYPVLIIPACDGGSTEEETTDGFANFDTSTIQQELLGSQTGMLVRYFDENNNELSSPLPNPFFSNTQDITVLIVNPINTNCSISSVLKFVVNPIPYFEVEPEQILCVNTQPTILKPLNFDGVYTYEWYNETGDLVSKNENYEAFKAGLYSVIAINNLGCESLPRFIFLELSSIPNVGYDDITIVDDSDNNTIYINNEGFNLGEGEYEFALNDIYGPYQSSSLFENVPAGIHTIHVRDINNCGSIAIDVSVIGFPKFFTPNNDGFNDSWNVQGVTNQFYPVSLVYIYNRFGKLLGKIDPMGEGWNGIFNGKPLPASDYWFSVQLEDKNGIVRNRNGHFSLVRR